MMRKAGLFRDARNDGEVLSMASILLFSKAFHNSCQPAPDDPHAVPDRKMY
jgi:hypothetical protein